MGEQTKYYNLVVLLRDLERDPELQKNIKYISSIPRWSFVNNNNYIDCIRSGLRRLVKSHLQKLSMTFTSEVLPCACVYLSYDSVLLNQRVKQSKCMLFRNDYPKDKVLADYLSRVINNVFLRIKTKFQLHTFSQEKLLGLDNAKRKQFVRSPVFFVCNDKLHKQVGFPLPTRWTSDSFNQKKKEFKKFVNKHLSPLNKKNEYGDDDLSIYAHYMSLLSGCRYDNEFRLLRTKELGSHSEPPIKEKGILEIEQSQSILREAEIDGINFCSIAISDELSNQPLGTAIIFYSGNLMEETTWDLHELFFEYMNAIRKVEMEVKSRIEESRELLGFVDHEVGNETVKIGIARDLDEARFRARYLSVVSGAAHSIASQDPVAILKRDEFEVMIRDLEKYSQGKIKVTKLILNKPEYDNRFLFIIFEASRNGVKHARPKHEAMVTLNLDSDVNGNLLMECVSQPHKISDLVNPIQEKIGANGAKIIKSTSQALSYTPSWKAERLPNSVNQFRVIFSLVPSNQNEN